MMPSTSSSSAPAPLLVVSIGRALTRQHDGLDSDARDRTSEDNAILVGLRELTTQSQCMIEQSQRHFEQNSEFASQSHAAILEALSRISSALSALDLPDVRIKDYDSPASSAVIRLRSTYAALLASACVHLAVSTPARLFWFDQSGIHELTTANYADVVATGRVSELFLAASTPPGTPALSMTKSRRSTESQDSTGRPGQAEFREALLHRDGAICVMCRLHASLPRLLDAAHIVPFATPSSEFRRYGLATIHDVRNGIMLCKLCHDAFDRYLWYVRSDGAVVVADALLLDSDFGPRWKQLASNSVLLRPTDPEKSGWWPSPLTWTFREKEFAVKQKIRQAASAGKAWCTVCGGYVSASRLSFHQSGKVCSLVGTTGRKDVKATPPLPPRDDASAVVSEGDSSAVAAGTDWPASPSEHVSPRVCAIGATSTQFLASAMSPLQSRRARPTARDFALTPPRWSASVSPPPNTASRGVAAGRIPESRIRWTEYSVRHDGLIKEGIPRAATAATPDSAVVIYKNGVRIELHSIAAAAALGRALPGPSVRLHFMDATLPKTIAVPTTPAGGHSLLRLGGPLSSSPTNAALYASASSICRVGTAPLAKGGRIA